MWELPRGWVLLQTEQAHLSLDGFCASPQNPVQALGGLSCASPLRLIGDTTVQNKDLKNAMRWYMHCMINFCEV